MAAIRCAFFPISEFQYSRLPAPLIFRKEHAINDSSSVVIKQNRVRETGDDTGWILRWVNKKQQTIYEKQFLSGDDYYNEYFSIAVESCNGKQLTYMYNYTFNNLSYTSTVVVVDAKGKEAAALPTCDGWYNLERYGDVASVARTSRQVHSDKKGVFTIVETADNVICLTYSTFK